jgi:hypothetical protein
MNHILVQICQQILEHRNLTTEFTNKLTVSKFRWSQVCEDMSSKCSYQAELGVCSDQCLIQSMRRYTIEDEPLKQVRHDCLPP